MKVIIIPVIINCRVDIEINLKSGGVEHAVVEIGGLDDVNDGDDDGVGPVLDGLQQRPQPVRLALAVRVQEHDDVTGGVAGARQPRARQPDAAQAQVNPIARGQHNPNLQANGTMNNMLLHIITIIMEIKE